MILGHDKPPLTEDLVHFGVKGMKWGVRKKKTSDADNFDIIEKHGRNAVKGLILTGVGVAVTAAVNPAALPFALMTAKTAAITTMAFAGAEAANDILAKDGKKSFKRKR